MSQDHHEEEVLGKAYDSRLMKRLLRYLKPYRFYVVLAIALAITGAALGALRPRLTPIIVDDYIKNGNEHGLTVMVLVLFGLMLVQGVTQYTLTYLTEWIGQRTIFDLRTEVFTHLQRLSLKFFDRNPVGRLVTRVTNDVEVLNEMFSSGLVMVFADIFTIIWIVYFMFSLHWKLALVTLSVLPFLIYGTFLFRKKVRETYRQVRIQVARLNAYMNEHITGMNTVQIFGREKKSFERFNQINAGLRDANVKSVFYYAIFYPSVDFISALAVALIIWYGGSGVLSNYLTLGILISFMQYTEMFLTDSGLV